MSAGANVCVCLLVASIASISLGDAKLQRRSASLNPLLNTVKLRIYGSSLDDHSNYTLTTEADGLLTDSRFNASKPTMFYFHGYNENAESESVKTVVSAFLAKDLYNEVVVDWSVVAGGLYFLNPLLLCPNVGRLLAEQLDQWHMSGNLSISNVYVVGHSLGGEAAAFTGKSVTQAKLPRITALDPAYPGFNIESDNSTHLAATDALFVDVIHTDGGVNGLPYSAGHVDFFPNGGRSVQPGCPKLALTDLCSHRRSWQFFAESLNSTLTPFVGVACDSQDDFKAGVCAGNETVVMGFYTPTSARGQFFLETADEAPFSKGEEGLTASSSSSSFLSFLL